MYCRFVSSSVARDAHSRQARSRSCSRRNQVMLPVVSPTTGAGTNADWSSRLTPAAYAAEERNPLPQSALERFEADI